jgi:hypothetical protein
MIAIILPTMGGAAIKTAPRTALTMRTKSDRPARFAQPPNPFGDTHGGVFDAFGSIPRVRASLSCNHCPTHKSATPERAATIIKERPDIPAPRACVA